MKDIDVKNTPEVSGGVTPPQPGFPWPTDEPKDPTQPVNPFEPWTDPAQQQT